VDGVVYPALLGHFPIAQYILIVIDTDHQKATQKEAMFV
jgi:hypothetical protein